MNKSSSNYQINKEIYNDYIHWLESSKYLEIQFKKLASSLEEFYFKHLMVEERYTEKDYHKDIAKYLHLTLDPIDCNRLNIINNGNRNDNKVDFDQQGVVDGYIIWHFLDRYLRFQTIYLSILKHGLLPLTNTKINHLDIGTGPASAIFALSDIYRSIITFSKENHFPKLSEIDFESDYVENSQNFRNWLHHFTELANYRNRQDGEFHYWKVPYQHGSFIDAYNTSFQQKKWWDKYIRMFNIVTIGNFITEEKQVQKLEYFFLGLFKVLKLGGIVILSGGGSNIKYFDEVAELFTKNNINHIKIFEKDRITFNHSINPIKILNQFYNNFSNVFISTEVYNLIDSSAQELLNERMHREKIRSSWKLYIFYKGIIPKIYRN